MIPRAARPRIGRSTPKQVIEVFVEPVEQGAEGGAGSPDDTDAPAQTASKQGASAAGNGTVTAVSTHRRLIGVRILIGVTTLLLIVGMFAVWANRLLLNADNWSSTSTQLLQNQAIRSTTANYLVDQLYANYNVAGLIRSGLPKQLEPLAGPAAGALRNAAVSGTELALSRPRIQGLWMQANRAADQAFIAIVNGGKGHVAVQGGEVTLNLAGILDDIATRLGLPSGIASKLPPNIAHLTVLKSNQLRAVQDGGKAVRGLALLLTILCPLLYALAILLAPGQRRRTLMTIGFAAIFAAVLVLAGRRILENQIPGSLTADASLQETIRAVVAISTGLLKEVATGVLFVGLLLVAAAWFAGPQRLPRTAREAIAPFLREHRGPTFAITLALLALLFLWDPIPATGTPAGIITFTVLALFGTEVLIRQTAAEFPEAQAGAATEEMRTRWTAWTGPRRPADPGPSTDFAGTSTADELRQLAELRDRGELTPDEYSAAKSHLLYR